MTTQELSFASVDEVVSRAAFHRRMGDARSTDEAALREALEEALANNDVLRVRAEDLDRQAEELADKCKELEEAEASLDCDMLEVARERGETCASKVTTQCARCEIAALRREHAAALTEAKGAHPAADPATLNELDKLRAWLENVTAERNDLLLQLQRGAVPAKAPSRTRKAPPSDQIGLFALVAPPEEAKPSPEKKPKGKREKKKRLWCDAKVRPKAKRARKAVSK